MALTLADAKGHLFENITQAAQFTYNENALMRNLVTQYNMVGTPGMTASVPVYPKATAVGAITGDLSDDSALNTMTSVDIEAQEFGNDKEKTNMNDLNFISIDVLKECVMEELNDILYDEFGESIDYLGLQGIKSSDNYYLTDKDAIGASNGINTFLDGDKAHWCGPTLSATHPGGDGSWFNQQLSESGVDNSQIGTFYYHHAGWGGFQSGTSCIDWAYTQLIMHYPATNYYGKGGGTINDIDNGNTQYDLDDELAGLAGQTDWNGGRASARIAEVKSPLPNNMWGGNDDIEGVGTDMEGDYNPLRVRTKIHYNNLNSYYDEACPQWGCTSFQGSNWVRSWADCDYYNPWYGESECKCQNTLTGEEIYNDDESVNAYSIFSWTSDDLNRILSGNGIPNHEVGTFPNNHNPNTISGQTVNESFTLCPIIAYESGIEVGGPGSAIAYALNKTLIK